MMNIDKLFTYSPTNIEQLDLVNNLHSTATNFFVIYGTITLEYIQAFTNQIYLVTTQVE